MRALVLNDTRCHRHVGCDLVMKNLLRLSSQHGLRVMATVTNSATDDEDVVRERDNDYDLLLINGEGTFHHDLPKAHAICRAARHSSKRGKFVVLLNTVWQENVDLNQYLPFFDLIFCRESKSRAEILAQNQSAEAVPDLVFATDLKVASSHKEPSRGTVVIDSVDRKTTLRWARQALFRRYAFFTMHEVNYQRLRRRPLLYSGIRALSGVPVGKLDSDFAAQLGRFERVISGRFHGCCLAFLRGLPVLGLPSNTHKIEGLFDDVGVGPTGLIPVRGPADLDQRFRFVQSRLGSVRRYVRQARSEIDQMFGRIQHCVHERKAS